MILDFNKKEEFALNYFSEFLNKEFHLPFDTIQAFENDNPELTEELVFELKKPLDTAEKYQALLGRTTDYLKEMNSVLLCLKSYL